MTEQERLELAKEMERLVREKQLREKEVRDRRKFVIDSCESKKGGNR